MSFRRRIALWLDPTLASTPPQPEPLLVRLDSGYRADVSRSLEAIAKSLASIDRKTMKRRPRVTVCRHPELHPELEAVA